MKKKKLTYTSLAWGNLKKKKKQYIIMILGIVLSMIFSSGVIYFAFSAYDTSAQKNAAECGYYTMFFSKYDEQLFEELHRTDTFEEIGYGYVLGYVFTDEDDTLSGTSIVKLDKVSQELVNPLFISGTYPDKKGEIAIEQTTLLQMGITAEAGDEITLKFQVQNDNELLPEIKEKTYTLSGIMVDKRNNVASGFEEKRILPAAIVSEDEKINLGGKPKTVVYSILAENGFGKVYTARDKMGIENLECVNSFQETFNFDSDEWLSFSLVMIVVCMLWLASSIGIINAFTTNLKERKKQIGYYRAVGATKRQVFKLFGREALILSTICTPLSLVISYLAVKLVIGYVFEKAYFSPNIWVLLICGAFSIMSVMLASLIPLFAASRITPMQAIRNIETARKLKNKKVKTQKNFKVSKLLAKRNLTVSKSKQIIVSIFLVVTILFSSYALSAMTYAINDIHKLANDYELHLYMDSMYGTVNFPVGNNGFTENHLQTVLFNENIASANGLKRASVNILVDDAKDLSDYRYILHNNFYHSGSELGTDLNELDVNNFRSKLNPGIVNAGNEQFKNLVGYKGDYLPFEIIALSEDLINIISKNVVDGEIDMGKINSGQQVIFVAPEEVILAVYTDSYGNSMLSTYSQRSHIEANRERGENVEIITSAPCDYKAGEKLDLSVLYCEEYNPDFEMDGTPKVSKEKLEVNNVQVEIGAVLNDTSEFTEILMYSVSNDVIITSIEGMNHFFPKARYKHLSFDLKDECDDSINKEVTALLESVAACVDSGDYSSNYDYQMEQKKDIQNFCMIICSMVILLFTICASIINNTIASNIKEDKKKIGTLRAVGANKKEISLSYIIQFLSMFKWGFGFGFGLFGASYLVLHLIPETKGLTGQMVFNPWITLAFGIILFVICSLSIYSKIRKEMKNSIVENIREL